MNPVVVIIRRGVFLLLVAVVPTLLCGSRTGDIKAPAVAGAFYPADAVALRQTVDRTLSAVHPAKGELRPFAVIVPHAGYEYSAAVAAEGFARLKGQPVSKVILVGPSHHVPLNGVALYPGDGMRTPLGVVPVAVKVVRQMAHDAEQVRLDAAPFAREHSLEVQLPFIQRAFGTATPVVPILVGSPTRESLAAVTRDVGRILREDPHALLVISTDLSHYHDQTTARKMDNRMIDAVERLSTRDLERLSQHGQGEMCGVWPAVYGIAAARAAGGSRSVLYRAATSGDVTGDRKRVVGYAAMGIERRRMTRAQKQQLLELARRTIGNRVRGENLPDSATREPIFRTDGAAFVTLNGPGGRLRGCIGTIIPNSSLYESVIRNAATTASGDPRFKPVAREELAGLSVEVSVLSPLTPISDPAGIVIGRDGVYLEKGGQSAVFLPQVPVEAKWDLPTYLAQLAVKAGLPPDGWRGARLSVFTAEVLK